jgi:hypothetical protein
MRAVPDERAAHLPGSKRKLVSCDPDYKDAGIFPGQEASNKKLKSVECGEGQASPKQKRKEPEVDSEGNVVKEEKRLRRFRAKPPQSYLEIKNRALTQRLTILGRERCGTDEVPGEMVKVAGTTGNVYTVQVGKIPRCSCPHSKKGNQCKHIIYVSLPKPGVLRYLAVGC